MKVMSASFSRQRILSLWLPRLPTDRLARSCGPSPDQKPTVIYGKRGNLDLIVTLDGRAEALGLYKGLAMAQARAMHPGIVAIEEEPHADARLLDMLADWCLRYTPLIACDPPDGLLLDITGCAHLYGGEERLIADLAARLKRAGLAQRIAVAGTIGAAFATARYGKPGIHANGEERTLIAAMPTSALRVTSDISTALARVGLKRIGDIVDLPRAPLTARFGADLLRQLDRALGREEEPLRPRLPVAPYIAEQRFPEPIARQEDVLAVIEVLAKRLKATLERQGDGARRLELTLFRTDVALRRVAAGTSRPLRDPIEIRALFVERLAALNDDLDPGFGFDMARLAVAVAEPCPDEQTGLSDSNTAPALARLIDHLGARLGRERVRRLIAQDSHIPEIAATSLPAQVKVEDNGWTAFRHYRAGHGVGPRPLRLLQKPEAITAVAQVPDGPPQRFWWRNAVHEVVAAEGPERIEDTWWTKVEPKNTARDYFRVEDQSGLRFWLFRCGLYRNMSQRDWDERRFPQWFMHGAFG
jgi:protein ImuB